MSNQTQAITTSEKRKNVRSLLTTDGFKRELLTAVPKHLTVDHLLRVVLTSINKTPKLMECTQESLLACVMDCAQLGLEPDGRNAYLIPFEDRKNNRVLCTLIVGYQGLVELAYRHPKVKGIRWNVVHEKDKFDYSDGLEARLNFTPCDEADPGPLTHAFAICEMEGGAKAWVVLNRRMVMKAKASSMSAKSNFSPWTTHEEAMWAKTAVRALCKRIPRSAELVQAMEKDLDERDDLADLAPARPVIGDVNFLNPPSAPQPEPQEPEQEPAPAPAAVPVATKERPTDVVLAELRIEMQTAGITEAQILAWGADAKRRYWPAKVKNLDELAQVNPDRIQLVRNSFGKIVEELDQVPA